MSSALKAANNQILAPFSQAAAPNAPKVLGNPRLTNFIFSFLPSSDWATGQRLCKAIKPDFLECQRMSGTINTLNFAKYLLKQLGAKQELPPFFAREMQAPRVVEEVRKIAAFVKRLEVHWDFPFTQLIKLLSGPENETLFPHLRALSCDFRHYNESIHSQYPETIYAKVSRRTRLWQGHCPEAVALKTLLSLGTCCPELVSLEILRGETDDKPCEALVQGIVEPQNKGGEHRLAHLKITTLDASHDPRKLLDLCGPQLKSWSLHETRSHFGASLRAPLTEIVIGNHATAAEVEALAGLPTLTSVHAPGRLANKASHVHLSKIPHLQHLTFDGLDDEGNSGARINDLSCFSAAKELRTLELRLHGDGKAVTLLKTIPPHIQRLILDDIYGLCDDDLEGFARFADLREFNLLFSQPFSRDQLRVTDRGLASLARCNQLRTLSIGGDGSLTERQILFTADGILALALDCVHLPHLQTLDLRRFKYCPSIDVEKIDAVVRERRPKLQVYITEKAPKSESSD